MSCLGPKGKGLIVFMKTHDHMVGSVWEKFINTPFSSLSGEVEPIANGQFTIWIGLPHKRDRISFAPKVSEWGIYPTPSAPKSAVCTTTLVNLSLHFRLTVRMGETPNVTLCTQRLPSRNSNKPKERNEDKILANLQ